MSHRFHVVLMTLGSAVCSGCSGTGAEEPPGSSSCSPDLASIQAAIFAPSCAQAGCHGPNEPAAGLDLTQVDLAARLIEAPASTCERTLVVPAVPEQSFLFEKISAPSPSCGERMPPAGSLGPAAIECVRQWILGMEPGCETCGGAGCADLQADPMNCGDCGVVCPSGATCAAGACQCAQGVACGDACVDTTSDPEHCGDCDVACGPGQVCSLGACAGTCDPSLTQCGSSCVDTGSDPMNCGDCGVSCGVGGSCDAGTCVCAGGADTNTDPNNCGACGNVCAPGQSCVGGVCTCASASVSFSADVQPIFTVSCATNGCHRGMMPQAGLDLTVGKSYQDLVNVTAEQCNDGRKRVLPGQPSESYIMDKIQNVDVCMGTKMPKLTSLPASDVEIISSWICAGAPDN